MVKLNKPAKKPLFSKKPKKAVDKTPKKSFDFKEFADSFKSLDQNNYGSWPVPVKITTLLFIVALVGLLAWLLPISKKREEISLAESEQTTLLEQYREKESKARHLKAYKEQIVSMEADFTELLNQLPKEARNSDLIEGINAVGIGSGISFQYIRVEPEVNQEFFIEKPIRIAASGNYHQFGSFLSGLAQLPRIITLHDFEVVNPQPSLNQLPQTNLLINTKTYLSKEAEAPSEGASNEAK